MPSYPPSASDRDRIAPSNKSVFDFLARVVSLFCAHHYIRPTSLLRTGIRPSQPCIQNGWGDVTPTALMRNLYEIGRAKPSVALHSLPPPQVPPGLHQPSKGGCGFRARRAVRHLSHLTLRWQADSHRAFRFAEFPLADRARLLRFQIVPARQLQCRFYMAVGSYRGLGSVPDIVHARAQVPGWGRSAPLEKPPWAPSREPAPIVRAQRDICAHHERILSSCRSSIFREIHR